MKLPNIGDAEVRIGLSVAAALLLVVALWSGLAGNAASAAASPSPPPASQPYPRSGKHAFFVAAALRTATDFGGQ
jgi:hypothetical protein